MNIHEYQARELFGKFGVATQPGRVADTAEEAEKIAVELGKPTVVKAQIHAGGRGKGTFKSGFKGGVHLAKSASEARDFTGKMLGQTLVTHQTGPEGKLVGKVFVGEAVDIAKELYFAILQDRATSGYTIIASTEGGVNIEEVAEHTPEKITREHIHPQHHSFRGGAKACQYSLRPCQHALPTRGLPTWRLSIWHSTAWRGRTPKTLVQPCS